MNWSFLLTIWLPLVAVAGLVANAAMIRWGSAGDFSVPALLPSIGCGLTTHVIVMAAALLLLSCLPGIRPEGLEAIGYFLGPFVLAFVAVPVGVLGYRVRRRRIA